jgi:hypothetical protein
MHLNGCTPAELFGQEVHAFLTMVNSAKEDKFEICHLENSD